MRWFCVHPGLPAQAELRVRAAPDASAPECARLAQGQVLAVCAPAIETPSADATLTWLPVALADDAERAYVLASLPDGTSLLAPWEAAGFQSCCSVVSADALLFDGPTTTAPRLGPVENVQFPYGVVDVEGSRARIAHPEHESAWIETAELRIECARLRHAGCANSHAFFTLNEALPAEAQIAIRAFPSREAETVGLLSRGDVLEATTRSGNWLQVAREVGDGKDDALWIMCRTDALELLVEVAEQSSSRCQRALDGALEASVGVDEAVETSTADPHAEHLAVKEDDVAAEEMETSSMQEDGEQVTQGCADIAPEGAMDLNETPSDVDAKDEDNREGGAPSVEAESRAAWEDRPLDAEGSSSLGAKEGSGGSSEGYQGHAETHEAEDEEVSDEFVGGANGTVALATTSSEGVAPVEPMEAAAAWDDRPIRPLRTQDQRSWDEYPPGEQSEGSASSGTQGKEDGENGKGDEDMDGVEPIEDADAATEMDVDASGDAMGQSMTVEHEEEDGRVVSSWEETPVGRSAARGSAMPCDETPVGSRSSHPDRAIYTWDDVPVGPRCRKKENYASAWDETPLGFKGSDIAERNRTEPETLSTSEATNGASGSDKQRRDEDAVDEAVDEEAVDEAHVDTQAPMEVPSAASSSNGHTWDERPVGPRSRLKEDHSAAWEETPVGSHVRKASLHDAAPVAVVKPVLPVETIVDEEHEGEHDVGSDDGDVIDEDDDEAPTSELEDGDSTKDETPMETEDQPDQEDLPPGELEVELDEEESAPSPTLEDRHDSAPESVESAEEDATRDDSPASSSSSVAKEKSSAGSGKKADGILYLMQFGMGAYCRRKQTFVASSDELSRAMYDAQTGDSDVVLQALVGDDPLCDDWFHSVSSKVLQAASQTDPSKFLDVLDSHDRGTIASTAAKTAVSSAAHMFAVPPSSVSVALEEKIDRILHRSPVKADSTTTYDLIMGDADADAILEAELDVANEGDFDLLSSFRYPEPKRRAGVAKDGRTASLSKNVPSSSPSSVASADSESSTSACADGNSATTEGEEDDAVSASGSESSQASTSKRGVSAIAKSPSPRAVKAAAITTPPRTPATSRRSNLSAAPSLSAPPAASGLPQRRSSTRTSGIAKPGGSLLRPRSSTSAATGSSGLPVPSTAGASPVKATRSVLPRRSLLPTPSPSKTRGAGRSGLIPPSAIPGPTEASSGLSTPRRMTFGFRHPTAASPKK